jgi:DNA-binding response OmpR family regulator
MTARVLLIEDDPNVAEVVARNLRRTTVGVQAAIATLAPIVAMRSGWPGRLRTCSC